MKYNLFATLLTEEAVDILVTNLFKKGYALSPLNNNYFKKSEISALLCLEITTGLFIKDLILEVSSILKANKCSYLSLLVVTNNANTFETSWLPGFLYKEPAKLGEENVEKPLVL
jgi:hypothetical protein